MILAGDIEKQGKPYWIPGASREDLPELFKSLGFKRGVELGVSWAQNIIGYCEAGFEICGIDPWKDSRDNIYRKIVSIHGCYKVDEVYELAKKRTEKYPNCKLIRKLSMDALDDFEDNSLDFIYIDANHFFGYVAMDLMQWSKKVRKGGIIAGHDYYSTEGVPIVRHVGNVVDAFVKGYDIPNFWVLGSKDNFKDRDLSYFFLNIGITKMLKEICENRNYLPKLFKEMGFKVGAEIGVLKGEFTEKFKDFKMYAIDPWIAYEGAGRSNNRQDLQDLMYEEVRIKLFPYDCVILRKTSMEALKDFEDGSLDFVYIDGDHRFQYVAEDIVEWTKKVKKGGVVSGHDYICTDSYLNSLPIKKKLHLQVGAIVDAYVKAFGIEDFYVLKGEGDTINDKFLSWYFVKK